MAVPTSLSVPVGRGTLAPPQGARQVAQLAPRAVRASSLWAAGRERVAVARAEPERESSAGASTEVVDPKVQAKESSEAKPKADPLAASGRRRADSTDPIATFLTRRFGLVGGFAWLGFLAVGSLGEQVKTRIEYANENGNTKDIDDAKTTVLPSGVAIKDTRVGGGSMPYKGALVLLNFRGMLADGTVFEDTFARGKPIVYLFGSRPFSGGMCAGLEEAVSTMKVNGRRTATVPASLAYGPAGAMLRPTEHVPEKRGLVPPDADITFEIELVRVSIPPS